MSGADDVRNAQRAAWAALSAGWDRWDATIGAQLRPVASAMIDSLGLRDGQRHLDIASGTGEPGLTIAAALPRGRVVLTDLSPEMLQVAARRARARGLGDVAAAVCSADGLPFGDAAFDSISVRFGYMFFPDLAAATAEFARVLRPGGRLCASVWREPDRNPWTTVAMGAIAAEVPLPAAPPDAPGMYRCAAPGRLGGLYAAAGLQDVVEWDVDVELVTGSPEQYWDVVSEHVSPAVAALRTVDGPARDRIRARAIDAVRPFGRDGAVHVPGAARCVVGTKPGARDGR